MKNKQEHINNVKTIVKKSSQMSNGSDNAALEIDAQYLLIPKFLFPKPTVNSNGNATLTRINERDRKGDSGEMRKLAYEYLAMADYVDHKKIEEAKALKKRQFEAFKLLYPTSAITEGNFNYDAQVAIEQRAIDVVSNLLYQIDNR